MTQQQKIRIGLLLAVSQWLLLLIPGASVAYFGIGFTVVLLHLMKPSWWVAVIQIPLVFMAPYAAIRILMFALWVPVLERYRRLPLRFSVLLAGVLFLFLARFDQFRISVVFPGVMAAGAMVYAISRVPGTAVRMARLMTPYLLTILPYIVVFLALDGAYRDRPVSAIPLDLIQIVVSVVVIQTLSGEGIRGLTGDEAVGSGSEHDGHEA